MKKIIFIILLSMLCCGVCFGQSDEQTKRFILFDDFSGGLASHVSELSTPLNKCQIAQNVRFDDKFGALSKRNLLRSYGDTGGDSVNGLYRFYKSDGTEKLITATGTVLQVGTDSTGAFTSIQTGLTDGARWDFVTYKDNLILASSGDTTYKYDGHTSTGTDAGDRTANYLCTELGAPYAEIAAGTTLDANAWYQYRVLFVDRTSDITYYSLAESNKLLTGATAHNIALSDIPLGKTGVTERQLYRTEGAASAVALDSATFKLLTTLSDNSTQIYADSIADGSLGAEWSTTGANNITPLTGSIVNIASERLFLAGNSDDKSHIFWSDERNPDWFDRDSYYPIRPDDGDEITFIETLLGKTVIGKTNTIQFFHTDGADTSWYPSDAFSFIGCPAQYSACSTPIGIVYLGRHGLYTFTGQYSKLLSDPVTDIMADIKQSNLDEVFGMYWKNQYMMAYTSDESGLGYNNRLLIYDTKREAFSIDLKDINCMASLNSGNDFGALYYGASNLGVVTSEGSNEQLLIVRDKSELDSGDFDDTDTFGTESTPYLELAWELTIDGVEGTSYDLTINNYLTGFPDAIIDRPDDYGYWLSPGYEVNATTLNKLYWNENLGAYGDITARVRSAASEALLSSATWSDNFTAPSGSDLSSLTAGDFMQLSFDLSTTNILYTPRLTKDDNFVWKVSFSLEDSPYETSVAGVWQSGWIGVQGYKITIRRIRVFYEADSGTLSFDLSNFDSDKQINFDIDLSQSPIFTDSLGGEYLGYEGNKVYSYYPPFDSTGELWRLKISDNQDDLWKVKRVEIMYEAEELVI